jgi:hypothetical protein
MLYRSPLQENAMRNFTIAAMTLVVLATMFFATVSNDNALSALTRAEGFSVIAMPADSIELAAK